MSIERDPTFAVPKLTVQEHQALKALAAGEAEPYQQVLALEVIRYKFSKPQDLLFIPGSFEKTGFIQGRAFIESRVAFYLKKPVGKTQQEETSDVDS